jgi:hypothetical protein
MRQLSLLTIAVAALFFNSCERTEVVSPSSVNNALSSSNVQRDPNFISPENENNPYDYVGQYVENILIDANSETGTFDYQQKVSEYISEYNIEMFDFPCTLSQEENAFFQDFATEFDAATNVDEQTQVCLYHEEIAVASEALSALEKERVLSLLASVKYAFYFSGTTGISIEEGQALSFVFDAVGYNEITMTIDNQAGPVGRPKCREEGIVGQGNVCVMMYSCHKTFLGFQFGQPYIAYGAEFACGEGA